MGSRYIKFYKPYGYLSQFSSDQIDHKTLSEFSLPKDVYCCGRLDRDSEGLLILTNDGKFQAQMSNPKFGKSKVYYAQVEGVPREQDLDRIRNGLQLKDYLALPAQARIIAIPVLPERDPPIRFRKNIATTWLQIILKEGKNRQVRKMTAAIGHPTLRLHRQSIGEIDLGSLEPGQWEYF